MKYPVLLSVVICFFSMANAQTSIGLNVSSSLKNNSHTVENKTDLNNSNSDFALSAGPMLRFMLGSGSELDPYAGINFSNKNAANATISQLGLWLGCGYFFHVVRLGILTFSMGPDLALDFYLPPSNSGSDYSKYDIVASVPLNFDFDFYRKTSIRISADAFTIAYSHFSEVKEVSDNAFNYYLQSIMTPSFTFFITF